MSYIITFFVGVIVALVIFVVWGRKRSIRRDMERVMEKIIDEVEDDSLVEEAKEVIEKNKKLLSKIEGLRIENKEK